jgi:hypothetical protein
VECPGFSWIPTVGLPAPSDSMLSVPTLESPLLCQTVSDVLYEKPTNEAHALTMRTAGRVKRKIM